MPLTSLHSLSKQIRIAIDKIAADRAHRGTGNTEEYERDFLIGLIFIRIHQEAIVDDHAIVKLIDLWTQYQGDSPNKRFHDLFREHISSIESAKPQYSISRLKLFQRFVKAIIRLAISEATWRFLICDLLYAFRFNSDESTSVGIGPEILGRINELTGNSAARINSGVFYTSKAEASLVAQFALGNWMIGKRVQRPLLPGLLTGSIKAAEITSAGPLIEHLKNIRIIDPACGAGTLLVEAFALVMRTIRLLSQSLNLSFDAIRTTQYLMERSLHGCDTDNRALAIAEARLWLMSGAHCINANLIEQDELLSDHTGSCQFDIVIGNPPFVRHEKIASLGQSQAGYKRLLHNAVRRQWPTWN